MRQPDQSQSVRVKRQGHSPELTGEGVLVCRCHYSGSSVRAWWEGGKARPRGRLPRDRCENGTINGSRPQRSAAGWPGGVSAARERWSACSADSQLGELHRLQPWYRKSARTFRAQGRQTACRADPEVSWAWNTRRARLWRAGPESRRSPGLVANGKRGPTPQSHEHATELVGEHPEARRALPGVIARPRGPKSRCPEASAAGSCSAGDESGGGGDSRKSMRSLAKGSSARCRPLLRQAGLTTTRGGAARPGKFGGDRPGQAAGK